MTYKGFTNRETYALHLYLTREITANRRALHIVSQAASAIEAATALSEWVTGELWLSLLSHNGGYLVVLDVGDLEQVNWLEIAEHLRGETDA